MSYLATIRKTASGYHVLWTARAGSLSSGPGLSRLFTTFPELISYLCTRTDFCESHEMTLRETLEKECAHSMELNPTHEEEDGWRALTSVRGRAS